ncbi:MAG: rhodanese-like domain-containing protein [Thermaerobacter sp.]|nr:rhodanese-like domain-containing protein [Thermaerobacter sp.]
MAITTVDEIARQVQSEQLTLLDTRPGHAYAKSHVPKSVSAPFSRGGWGKAVKRWLQGQDIALGILADNQMLADASVKALEDEGLAVQAVIAEGIGAWTSAGFDVVAIADISVDQLKNELQQWAVIDVREPYEWRSGVIPGAKLIPMNQLPDKIAELDKSTPYAVVCASGGRSQAAASFLADQGYKVGNVVGGMSLWLGARHPVEQPR